MSNLMWVIVALASTLLLSVAGIIWLASTGHTTPDVLQNIAIGALTALAGVLVPSPVQQASQPQPPQP